MRVLCIVASPVAKSSQFSLFLSLFRLIGFFQGFWSPFRNRGFLPESARVQPGSGPDVFSSQCWSHFSHSSSVRWSWKMHFCRIIYLCPDLETSFQSRTFPHLEQTQLERGSQWRTSPWGTTGFLEYKKIPHTKTQNHRCKYKHNVGQIIITLV